MQMGEIKDPNQLLRWNFYALSKISQDPYMQARLARWLLIDLSVYNFVLMAA